MLVFADHLSRFAEAVLLVEQKAETVARAFVQKLALRDGGPKQLLTDLCANFVSRVMKEFCELLSIKKLQTTPYHPECNSAVERLNYTLVGMSHFLAHDQREWDQWIPFAMFAYNIAVHEGTNKTPFFLLYGRDLKTPSIDVEAPKIH